MEIAVSSTNTIIINNNNNDDEININQLNYIRETIENMNKFNQIEILRLLSKHQDVIFNENKYGVHINLSELKSDIVNELEMYINYVNTQEHTLHQIEKQKETFKNIYFTKDNKDNVLK